MMHRRDSISSTQSHSRVVCATDVRDITTESLVTLEDRFLRKSRKSDTHLHLQSRSYCFPNGEVFRPRNAPTRRNKPNKIPQDKQAPGVIPRSASMVLMSSMKSAHSSVSVASSVSYLPSLPSFNNLKVKCKQDLVLLIRNNKLDTPTNINISAMAPTPPLAPPKFQPRLFLLTNNRYSENSTNIVRLERLLHNPLDETFPNGKNLSLDLNPSSLSNYNLNRSNSNTPQTSVSTTDIVNDNIAPHEIDTPVSLRMTPSLDLIKESGADKSNQSTAGLQKAEYSPSEETVGISQPGENSPQSPSSFNSQTSNSDNSAYNSAPEYASPGSRKSGEKADNGDQSTGSESSDENSLAALGIPASGSVSEDPTSEEEEAVDDLTFIPEGDSESKEVSPLEVEIDDTTLSSNSPEGLQKEEDSSISNAELHSADLSGSSNGDHLSEPKLHDSDDSHSEDSGQNSQDYTQDTQDTSDTADTVHSFDMAADATTVSSLKLSDLTSIVDRANNELAEASIVLAPSTKSETVPDMTVNNSGVDSSSRTTEKGTGSTIPGSPMIDLPSPTVSLLNEIPSVSKNILQDQPSRMSKDSQSLQRQPVRSMLDVVTPPPPSSNLAPGSELIFSGKNLQTANKSIGTIELSGLVDHPVKTTSPVVPEKARKVVSLLPPADEDLKSVHHEFSKRKNIDLRLILQSQSGTLASALMRDASRSISKDSSRTTPTAPSISDLASLGELHTPTNPPPRSESDQQMIATPGSDFSFRPGQETLQRKLSDRDDEPEFDVSELYTKGQIEKFLTDDQKEVPPRGDVDINGNNIKVHKRNTSSISSLNSSLQGRLPRLNLETVRVPPSELNPPRSILQLQNRLSMLNVVDVDFDKSLPPTPERKNKYTGRFSLLGDPLASPTTNNLPHKWSPSKENSPTEDRFDNGMLAEGDGKWRSFKKVFKMFGSDTNLNSTKKSVKAKWEPEMRATKKSLMASLRTLRTSNSLSGNAVSLNNASEVTVHQPLPTSQIPSRPLQSTSNHENASFSSAKLSKFATKRKKFVMSLKLASGGPIEDLPSPVYSAKDRSETPENFDLPKYEVESDSFEDLLLKFDEVEQKAEQEVEELQVNAKSLNLLFLKDDELTEAQIVDQQKNDNQLSDESLPRAFILESSEMELVGQNEEKLNAESGQNENDESWIDPDATLSQMKFEELVVNLPSENGEQRILLKKEALSELLGDEMNRNFPSFLKHVKQFQDFSEIEINVRDFDPTSNEEIAKSATVKDSILRTQMKPASNRTVEFSNTVFISETYPSYMYKRYNKSVTQYYLTEFAEVNRIKNELNAYKCHEMLVHEKSQMNTHFFY